LKYTLHLLMTCDELKQQMYTKITQKQFKITI